MKINYIVQVGCFSTKSDFNPRKSVLCGTIPGEMWKEKKKKRNSQSRWGNGDDTDTTKQSTGTTIVQLVNKQLLLGLPTGIWIRG